MPRLTADELHDALPKKSFYAVHAEAKLLFEALGFSAVIDDPRDHRASHSPKGRGNRPPVAGSLYACAAERFSSS
jgi:hypothetical protein